MVMLVKMVDEATSSRSARTSTATTRCGRSRRQSARASAAMTRGHQPGDILARLDLDPYHRSFRNVSTHILAPELTETGHPAALRGARLCQPRLDVRSGRVFLRADPGFGQAIRLVSGQLRDHGRRSESETGARLLARFPVACHVRLLRSGVVIAERRGESIEYAVAAPGVYRVEGWLDVGGEERGWVYSNPIYVR